MGANGQLLSRSRRSDRRGSFVAQQHALGVFRLWRDGRERFHQHMLHVRSLPCRLRIALTCSRHLVPIIASDYSCHARNVLEQFRAATSLGANAWFQTCLLTVLLSLSLSRILSTNLLTHMAAGYPLLLLLLLMGSPKGGQPWSQWDSSVHRKPRPNGMGQGLPYLSAC